MAPLLPLPIAPEQPDFAWGYIQSLVSETKQDKNTDSRVYSGPTEIELSQMRARGASRWAIKPIEETSGCKRERGNWQVTTCGPSGHGTNASQRPTDSPTYIRKFLQTFSPHLGRGSWLGSTKSDSHSWPSRFIFLLAQSLFLFHINFTLPPVSLYFSTLHRFLRNRAFLLVSLSQSSRFYFRGPSLSPLLFRNLSRE